MKTLQVSYAALKNALKINNLFYFFFKIKKRVEYFLCKIIISPRKTYFSKFQKFY